jgi:importin subunit alpha-1
MKAGNNKADQSDIASGTSEHTQVVIGAGAIPHFVRLLSSHVLDVREQA